MYIAIIINLITIVCVYYNIFNTYQILRNIFIGLNFTNIVVALYRNKNTKCKDGSCKTKH